MRAAIVVPRYGTRVVGGAETLARRFAQAGAQRGWEMEVWTTCAQSHYTWENAYSEGVEAQKGVLVRRFPIQGWDRQRWAELELRLAQTGMLSPREAYEWLDSAPHSFSLYSHVANFAADFDVVVALPYAAPLTHYAAWAASRHIVLWPCLHDEPYAYLEPVRLLLESVRGVMFNSPEELHLAMRRLKVRPQKHAVLGGGVYLGKDGCGTLSQKPSNPYILYVGRLEEGKNVLLLYEYMRRHFKEQGDIQLVVVGRGPVVPPKHPALMYFGFVSEEEKAALYRSALALCQPSLRESFSLTIMEAWLAGRPVLVHGGCDVTRGHVLRSKGGLWFETYEEFAGAMDWLRANPALARRMGDNGRRYVLGNYTWDKVLDRFESLILRWQGGNE